MEPVCANGCFVLICTQCLGKSLWHCVFWGQRHLLTRSFAEEDTVLLLRHTQVCPSKWELGQKYVSPVLWGVTMSLSSKPTWVWWMLLDFRCIQQFYSASSGNISIWLLSLPNHCNVQSRYRTKMTFAEQKDFKLASEPILTSGWVVPEWV